MGIQSRGSLSLLRFAFTDNGLESAETIITRKNNSAQVVELTSIWEPHGYRPGHLISVSISLTLWNPPAGCFPEAPVGLTLLKPSGVFPKYPQHTRFEPIPLSLWLAALHRTLI